MQGRGLSLGQQQAMVALLCGLALTAFTLFTIWHFQSALPGTALDIPSERFEVKPGEAVWQQLSVPACQPASLTMPLADPASTSGALLATFYMQDEADRWTDAPVASVETMLSAGQWEVRLPFPESISARRRAVRLRLTPQGTAIAFRVARELGHQQQYVTRRQGYLGIESILFRADYAASRWFVPLRCVLDMQYPNLHSAVLSGALLVICGAGGWLCGLAWRVVWKAA